MAAHSDGRAKARGLLRMTLLFVATPESHGLVSHPRGEGVQAADAARSAGALKKHPGAAARRRGSGSLQIVNQL
jgi:hypothetical protein